MCNISSKNPNITDAIRNERHFFVRSGQYTSGPEEHRFTIGKYKCLFCGTRGELAMPGECATNLRIRVAEYKFRCVSEI